MIVTVVRVVAATIVTNNDDRSDLFNGPTGAGPGPLLAQSPGALHRAL